MFQVKKYRLPFKKQPKRVTPKSLYSLLEGRERILNGFENKIFPLPTIEGIGGPSDFALGFNILTFRQMFQRLAIAIAQARASNTTEKLSNQIPRIIYSLYCSKEKVYINIMK